MKKLLIGSLVAGLILFIWQFLSWGLLDLHGAQMDYHPNQEAVLQVLEENLDEGKYFMLRAPRDASSEEQQAVFEERMGDPWAVVSYHESLEMNQGMNLLRGFIVDVVAALILCWILLNFSELNLKKAVLSSVGVGLIAYLTTIYLSSVYFPENTWPDFVDAIVPWALIGLWYNWWLNRK